MFVYLAPWVQFQSTPTSPVEFRPAGVDLLGAADDIWSTLRLDKIRQLCILGTRNPLPSLPSGVELLAEAITERLSQQRLNRLENRLGENLTDADLPTLLLALYTSLAGTKRWPLESTSVDGVARLVMWLAGTKFIDQPVVSGGAAEITDNFNRASLGSNWSTWLGLGMEIEASTVLKMSGDDSNWHGVYYNAIALSSGHGAYAQVDSAVNNPDGNRHIGAAVRLSATGADDGGYMGDLDNASGSSGFRIQEVDSGGSVTSIAFAADSGLNTDTVDTLKIVATGSSLEVFWGGVSKVSTTDATWGTSRLGAGCFIFGNADTSLRIDNFEAGVEGGEPPVPGPPLIVPRVMSRRWR